MAAENGGYDQGGFDLPSSRAYNAEPVLLREQRSTLAAVHHGFVFHTLRLIRLTTLQTCMQ